MPLRNNSKFKAALTLLARLIFIGACGIASAEGALESKLLQLADDPDPRVRFQLAFTLGELKSPDRIPALAKIALRDGEDKWVRSAVLSSVREEALPLLLQVANGLGQREKSAGYETLVRELAKSAAASRGSSTAELLHPLAEKTYPDWVRVAALRGAADGLEIAKASKEPSPDAENALERLLIDSSPQIRAIAREVALAALPSDSRVIRKITAEALASARNASLPQRDRVDAVEALGAASFSEIKSLAERLLSGLEPESLQLAALGMLTQQRDPAAADLLVSNWRTLNPNIKVAAVDAAFARPEWLSRLLGAIEAGEIPEWNIPAQKHARLFDYPDKEIAARGKAIYERADNQRDQSLYERYRPALELEGDPVAGEAIHKDRCAQCHKLGESGFALGPDLKSVKSNSPDVLLTNILYPSRAIQPGFTDYVIETTDGRVLNGIIGADTGAAIVLRRGGGEEETVMRSQIKSLRDTSLSIMPEGLEDGLSPQDMANLLAFIKSLD